jgi:hypothetical protein
MRWSYKTVHYELTKEGLLGSAFLDESAVELSLNEYGKAGWELVSMLETLDGLIAVFKQQLSLGGDPGFFSESENLSTEKIRPQVTETMVSEEQKLFQANSTRRGAKEEVGVLNEFEVVEEKETVQEDLESPEKKDVGAIRIE